MTDQKSKQSAVAKNASQLRTIMDDAAALANLDGSRLAQDEGLARKVIGWRRIAERLERAVERPTTVGVFGESQVGKSFLVSAFSGGGEGELCIRDPRGGKGLSFIKTFNSDEQEESTGIVCRFTSKPVDKTLDQNSERFVGQLMSHSDLILSLAIGYVAAYQLRKDYDQIEADLKEHWDSVKRKVTEKVPFDHPRLQALQEAWTIILTMGENSHHHALAKHVKALERLGFGAFIKKGLLPTSDKDWGDLVGMLWRSGPKDDPFLGELYLKLWGTLEKWGYPNLIEIPRSAVVQGDKQVPITNVNLLTHIFSEPDEEDLREEEIDVWVRPYKGKENRQGKVNRRVVAALLSELSLPVEVQASGADLLETADVLDFPGARSFQSSAVEEGQEEQSGRASAVAAFKRGKLTRLFSMLTEQREITVLCLVATKQNKEAAKELKPMLGGWLDVDRGGRGDGESPTSLFLAVTKSDMTLDGGADGENVDNRCPFGKTLAGIEVDYCQESRENHSALDWMANWNEGEPFKNVYFVHSPKHGPKSDEAHLKRHAQLKALYDKDPRISQHVVDPECVWVSLLKDGGIPYLEQQVADCVGRSDRLDRLSREIAERRRNARELLSPLYTDTEATKRREKALEVGKRDFDVIKAISGGPIGSFALSALLRAALLRPETVIVLLEELDRDVGKRAIGEAPTRLTFTSFWDRLRTAWLARVEDEFNSGDISKLLNNRDEHKQALLSLRTNLMGVIDLPWFQPKIQDALEPFLEHGLGALHLKSGLVMTACWTFNRTFLELDMAPERPEDPHLPPSLKNKDNNPSWYWILDHWERRLPEVYGDVVAAAPSIAPGNEELNQILVKLGPGPDWSEGGSNG